MAVDLALSPMIARPALTIANHLLAAEDWARDRFATFAGKTAELRLGGGIAVCARIGESGLLEMGNSDQEPSVIIELPLDSLAALFRRDLAFVSSSAKVSGSVDLAEALGFVFRNLRWDAEHDLAQLLGDVVARRVVQVGRSLATWHAASRMRLAQAVSEYLNEEAGLLARRVDLEQFCADVDALRDDLARFEKRVERATRTP